MEIILRRAEARMEMGVVIGDIQRRQDRMDNNRGLLQEMELAAFEIDMFKQ